MDKVEEFINQFLEHKASSILPLETTYVSNNQLTIKTSERRSILATKLKLLIQRKGIDKERERLNGELKGSVAKARANYQTLRDNLKKKHEQTLIKEFESIKSIST